MLASVSDVWLVAPLCGIVMLGIGFWIGGRFTIRKHKDNGNV